MCQAFRMYGREEGRTITLILLALALQGSQQQEAGSPQEQRKPFFERFRRLEEQFRRFQEVTLNRLQGIAENYNISYNIDAQFQHLTEQYRALTTTIDASRATLQSDLGSLKVWIKKLQRKNKKLELKVSSLEQAMVDRTKQSSREKKEQNAALSNLTQVFDRNRQDIASLASGRTQLQEELERVQDAIQSHGARIAGFEERLKHAVQNEVLSPRSLSTSQLQNETPQGKHLGSTDTDSQDKPDPRQSTMKLQTKHRQRKRLQERYQHLIPSRASKLQSSLRHNEAGLPELQIVAESQASRQPEKNMQEPQVAVEPYEPVEPHAIRETEKSTQDSEMPVELQVPAELHALRQPEKSRPDPQAPADPQVPAEQETIRMLDKSGSDPPVPAQLGTTRKPSNPAASEEQEPPPRVLGTICNVDSMLDFPNSSTENVAIFASGFQAGIHELSICSWVKTGASYLGTLLSYATEENDNKLVLHGRNTTSQGTVHFVIGDPAFRELPVVTLLDNRWHHICVIWSSIQGKYWFYLDRRLATTGSRFQKGYELPPGGSLVLGQEQDTMGGGFDSSEAFVGYLAGLAVWNRALSPGEVSGIATGKGRPRGAILTLANVSSVQGYVRKVNCTCLEHCL